MTLLASDNINVTISQNKHDESFLTVYSTTYLMFENFKIIMASNNHISWPDFATQDQQYAIIIPLRNVTDLIVDYSMRSFFDANCIEAIMSKLANTKLHYTPTINWYDDFIKIKPNKKWTLCIENFDLLCRLANSPKF